jgi:hypothetical protein
MAKVRMLKAYSIMEYEGGEIADLVIVKRSAILRLMRKAKSAGRGIPGKSRRAGK